jgi:hypothetical protein
MIRPTETIDAFREASRVSYPPGALSSAAAGPGP